MKNKFRILTLMTLIVMTLVGCDDAETKELKSLHKLGYEQAVEQYPEKLKSNVYWEPIRVLDYIIGDGSVMGITLSIDKNSEAYKVYKELAENEFENAEKMDALKYGFRNGYFDCLKNRAEYLSSTKGEKYLKNYLSSITEVNRKNVSDSIKLKVKDAIISYADFIYNELVLYEEENGEYTGEQLTVHDKFFSADDKFSKQIGNVNSNPLYNFANTEVWFQEYK